MYIIYTHLELVKAEALGTQQVDEVARGDVGVARDGAGGGERGEVAVAGGEAGAERVTGAAEALDRVEGHGDVVRGRHKHVDEQGEERGSRL